MDDMTVVEAAALLAKLVEWDDVHAYDCESTTGPPGPFPCDCSVGYAVALVICNIDSVYDRLAHYCDEHACWARKCAWRQPSSKDRLA